MGWTYTGKDVLASAASQLYAARKKACALSPYILMSDPWRTPDILRAAKNLPNSSALIYRHFGAADKKRVAGELRQICFARGVQFLIGQDEELARLCGADGLHLPEREIERGGALRRRYPNWLLSGAAHTRRAMKNARGLDAVIVSPVFKSQSPSAKTALGLGEFTKLARQSHIPVIALGGINRQNAWDLIESSAAGIAGVSAFTRPYD